MVVMGRVSILAAVAELRVERAAGAAAVGCRDLSALAAAFEARTLVVSVKVVVVCIVVRRSPTVVACLRQRGCATQRVQCRDM